MLSQKKGKEKARKYYEQEASHYIEMYGDKYNEYPANLIRINFILKRLHQNNIRSVFDVGCGTCSPMIKILKNKIKCKGIDFSQEMIKEGRINLLKAGFDSNLISFGDLESNCFLTKEKFDAIIALGVFPHIINEKKALRNIRKTLKKKGKIFIEFRNDLFSTFSLNNYSLDFFLNRIIDTEILPKWLLKEVLNFYSNRLKSDIGISKKDNKILFTDILAKFKNPLTIEKEIFNPCGFTVDKIHFYHYHALPPIFEQKHPELFRKLSRRLEKTEDWKGYFLASAFVIEATKK